MTLTRILAGVSFLFVCMIVIRDVFPTPLIVTAPSGELSLTGRDGVLAHLYGNHNLSRIDDRQDQIWMSAGEPVTVTARARFASFSFGFGYRDRTGFYSLFEPYGHRLTVSGLGVATPFSHFSWTLSPSGAPQWSSLTTENIDLQDHMVTFFIAGGNRAGGYVLAWEDLPFLGDRDYNDLVLEVQGVHPATIPEPATLVLLISGLILCAAVCRFRRRNRAA